MAEQFSPKYVFNIKFILAEKQSIKNICFILTSNLLDKYIVCFYK